jgi:hypothetical protein
VQVRALPVSSGHRHPCCHARRSGRPDQVDVADADRLAWYTPSAARVARNSGT